jgi:hypothetical protein
LEGGHLSHPMSCRSIPATRLYVLTHPREQLLHVG